METNHLLSPKIVTENVNFERDNAEIIRHLDLITVHKPYMALHSVHKHENCLFGTFPAEAHPENEIYPITITEVGRHMAILGSLAVAMENPVKEEHYYLALHAEVIRHSYEESFEKELVGKVEVTEFNRKGATITGEVFNKKGECIFSIVVDYSTIHHRTFSRLFKDHYKPEVAVYADNPYTKEVELFDLVVSENECTASLGIVDESICTGHFHHYPALPVARLGSAFCKLAGIHYNFLKNGGASQKYAYQSVEMTAYFLPFEGEEVFIKSQVTQRDDKGYAFTTTAFNREAKEIAELKSIII
ncbi:MAG: hypothetical protein Q8928_13315 [Bacteroidota bacterium]|nr:hypothetical protein [Bacteroidota bacterium]